MCDGRGTSMAKMRVVRVGAGGACAQGGMHGAVDIRASNEIQGTQCVHYVLTPVLPGLLSARQASCRDDFFISSRCDTACNVPECGWDGGHCPGLPQKTLVRNQ